MSNTRSNSRWRLTPMVGGYTVGHMHLLGITLSAHSSRFGMSSIIHFVKEDRASYYMILKRVERMNARLQLLQRVGI